MFILLNRTLRVKKFKKYSVICEFTVPANKYHQCLEEIGEIETERDGNKKYTSGQCFLHKLFAYRGIILCPWKGQMYSKNDKDKTKVKPTVELYYQVLRDSRDIPYTKIQTDCEKIHKFSKWNLMFSIQGLDNVLHDDILPYKSTNSNPLKHTMFNKLFAVTNNYLSVSRSTKILPKLYLYEWKRKYQPWLNSTQVHKITKDNIKITAMSFYAGKRKLAYWWLLGIRVENLSNDSIIIQGKDWRIYNNVTRELEKIKFKGPSLLCHETILPPESAAIQYYDYINLFHPEGVIGCYYRIINLSNLSSFICPILLFTLNSTITDHSHGENIIDWY